MYDTITVQITGFGYVGGFWLGLEPASSVNRIHILYIVAAFRKDKMSRPSYVGQDCIFIILQNYILYRDNLKEDKKWMKFIAAKKYGQ